MRESAPWDLLSAHMCLDRCVDVARLFCGLLGLFYSLFMVPGRLDDDFFESRVGEESEGYK